MCGFEAQFLTLGVILQKENRGGDLGCYRISLLVSLLQLASQRWLLEPFDQDFAVP
jgi:hypothetical protein